MKVQLFLDGLLCGVIIGTLFAPASGEETRRRLARRFSDFRNSLNKAHESSKEEAKDAMNELKEDEEKEIKEIYHEIKGDKPL